MNLTSPLNNTNENALTELLAKDPLMLTNEEIDTICNRLRLERSSWNTASEERKVKKAAPKLTPDERKAAAKAAMAQLDLTKLFE